MPRPADRSRSNKRISKALPGGRKTVHHRRGAASSGHCYLCGRPLGGTKHLSMSESRKLNRTKRTLSRPYGGALCPECLRNGLKQAARTLQVEALG